MKENKELGLQQRTRLRPAVEILLKGIFLASIKELKQDKKNKGLKISKEVTVW